MVKEDKHRAVRLEKLAALRDAGVNPYPYRFDVSHRVSEVVQSEGELTRSETAVKLAGRVMALRGHGKAAFGHIEDKTGRK